MLPIVIGVLAWFPSVMGFGFALWGIYGRCVPLPSPSSKRIFVGVSGLAVLSVVANLLNFFVPINSVVALAVFVCGWLLCVRYYRRFSKDGVAVRGFLLFALCLLACIGITAAKPQYDYETGVYHLQSIRWITSSNTPLGLANLSGPYTYNSAWFSIAAMLEIPLLQGKSSFVINTLLLFIYGFEIGLTATRFKSARDVRLSDTFFLLTTIAWLGQLIGVHLNVPSADVPVVVATLLSVYISICALESEKLETSIGYNFIVAFIGLFLVTVKLSTIPVLLSAAALFFWNLSRARRSRAHYSSIFKPLLLLPAITACFMIIPWMLRGIVLSGCFVYPVLPTCFQSLPWTVSPTVVEREVGMIKSWSRWPWGDQDAALADWSWLGPWLERTFTPGPVLAVASIFACAGLLFWLGNRKMRLAPDERPAYLLPLIMPIGGTIFWFFTAPDVRYGEGYLWSIFLFFLSAGVYRFYQAYDLKNFDRLLAMAGVCLAVFILGIWPSMTPTPWPVGTPWIKNQAELHPGLGEMIFAWPAIPEPQLKANLTVESVPIFSPIYRDQCWNTSRICAPFFNKDVRIIWGANNQPKMFYVQR